MEVPLATLIFSSLFCSSFDLARDLNMSLVKLKYGKWHPYSPKKFDPSGQVVVPPWILLPVYHTPLFGAQPLFLYTKAMQSFLGLLWRFRCLYQCSYKFGKVLGFDKAQKSFVPFERASFCCISPSHLWCPGPCMWCTAHASTSKTFSEPWGFSRLLTILKRIKNFKCPASSS